MMLCDTLDKADLADFIYLTNGEDNWIAEEKMDGDRIRLHFKGKKLSLISRGKSGDVTFRYPELRSFNLDHDVILDGEMCVLDVNGVSQFNEGIAFRTHCTTDMAILNASLKYPITYVVFDILELDGKDLKGLPWQERRKLLDSLNIKYKNMLVIPYSDDIIAKWKEVEDKGGEGIILKKRDAVYMENYRSSSWRKVKNIKEVDLTFIKYTVNPKGIRIETEDGHACQVSGFHAPPVRTAIDLMGKCLITIRHLGWTGRRYRQPVFAKIVVE